jgi:hypothetical protein
MGDPHKNTWGGKNNSWGHKPKSTQSNSDNSNRNQSDNLSGFGKVVIAGVCLFALSQTGLSPIIDTVGNIKDAFGTAEKVQEYTQKSTSTTTNSSTDTSSNTSSNSATSGTSTSSESFDFDVNCDIDIEASDIADLLSYIKDNTDTFSSYNNKEVNFVDYSSFDNADNYTKNILAKALEVGKTVTFIAVGTGYSGQESMQAEFDRISKIVDNTTDGLGAYFVNISKHVLTNEPNTGSITLVVTFIEK